MVTANGLIVSLIAIYILLDAIVSLQFSQDRGFPSNFGRAIRIGLAVILFAISFRIK
jgi:hypothetical protein